MVTVAGRPQQRREQGGWFADADVERRSTPVPGCFRNMEDGSSLKLCTAALGRRPEAIAAEFGV